jgi:hypothetical protein
VRGPHYTHVYLLHAVYCQTLLASQLDFVIQFTRSFYTCDKRACACWCAPEARLAVAAVAQCALEKGRARTSRCSTRAPVAPLGQRGSARGRGMSLLCV